MKPHEQHARLTPQEILSLSRRLPHPAETYRLDDVCFDLYPVKDGDDRQWKYGVLYRLLLEARMSYARYGNVPLFDEYDYKSWIYLIRVRYTMHFPRRSGAKRVEEWFSARFVPAVPQPPLTPDFAECTYRNGSLVCRVAEKLLNGRAAKIEKIVTVSKICGIHPYMADGDGAGLTALSRHHRYSAACFALINRHFFCDAAASAFRFLSGLFRQELIEKSLTMRSLTDGQRLPRFTPAYLLLDCPERDIVVNRPVSAYEFPAYFLDVKQLLQLLRRLIAKKIITYATLDGAIPVACDRDFVLLLEDIGNAIPRLRHLGKLLARRGKLPHTRCTGEMLRLFIDVCVADGPQLQIMNVASWKNSIERFFVSPGRITQMT
ncbi:MAG: hypothetical protein AAB539_00590 [Patescibacteria group bacterium]